jgi:glycopeptide antibiotics resistance protein
VSSRLWALFALFILYGTTIPFNFNGDTGLIRDRVAAMSWNPLIRPDGRRVAIPDAVQNFMLFVPFGALGGLACQRRVSSRASRAAAVTGAGAGLSALVETLQLLTVDRVSSTSDVLTNALGTLIGVMVVEQAARRGAVFLREYGSSRWMTSAWTYPGLVALAALFVAAWQPFDATLDVGTVGWKVRALYRDPWQRGPLTDEGSAVISYALATLALVGWSRASGVPRAWFTAVAGAAGLAVGLELSQALISSRTPTASDALVRLLGVAIGAGLVPVIQRGRQPLPWLVVLWMASVVSAAILTWSPFQVREQRLPFAWMPLLSSYSNNWFPAISHAIELCLLYFPFGFVLASIYRRRFVIWTAVMIATVGAVSIEYGQSWFVGRYADITDVAFSLLGAGLGAWFGDRGTAIFETARASAVAARVNSTR